MQADEHVFDLLPGYALGSLERLEEELAAKHLAVCAQCREELQTYQLIVDELPLASISVNPPPVIKQRLLVRAMATVNLPKSAAPNWVEKLITLFKGAAPAWSLISLVLVLALSTSNLFLWQRISTLEHSQTTKLMTVILSGTENMPVATGTLVLSRDGEYGTLVVDGMDKLDAAHQYQLWLIRGEQRTSGGVFSVDTEGYGYLAITAHQALDSYTSFGVTIEPLGGSQNPTGKKVLGGQL